MKKADPMLPVELIKKATEEAQNGEPGLAIIFVDIWMAASGGHNKTGIGLSEEDIEMLRGYGFRVDELCGGGVIHW